MIVKKQNKPQTGRIAKKTIIVLSTLQLLMYVWLLYTTYATHHDNNPTDYDWMGGFVPAGLFVLFGVINLIIFVVYAVQVLRAKTRPRTVIVALGVGLIALYVFLGPMINFVGSL